LFKIRVIYILRGFLLILDFIKELIKEGSVGLIIPFFLIPHFSLISFMLFLMFDFAVL